MADKLAGREIIIEYYPVGLYVKVSAMDTKTLTEISIQGPASAGQETLKNNALRRLEYVLTKKGLIQGAHPHYITAMTRKILIACDHGGFDLKQAIKAKFSDYEWIDLGTNSTESVDYPDYGSKLAVAIEKGEADTGIAICGSGIGISIAVNRNKTVRGALCTNVTMARLTRQHNNANVLCLGARITGAEAAMDIVKTFLSTEFEGGRHEARVNKLS